MARRLFYDPVDPRMLSEDEIGKLSPVEIQAACDQIDQNLVGVLQRIDENFSKAYQSLTSNILPAVEQYGQHSKDIWDSVKFWKFFFEAAANTKLGEPSVAADESFRSADLNNTVVSFAPQDGGEGGESTPRAANVTGTDSSDSPFQTLRKEIRALDGVPASASSQASSTSSMPHRLRLHELPPDSPDIPLPEFETLKLGLSPMPTAPTEGTRNDSPRKAKAGADKVHPDLLQKVLRKQHEGATPRSVRTKLQRPQDVPADWDGIVKLSDTPLSAFMSPQPSTNKPSSSSAAARMAASPLPKLGRTPKQDAASRMAQNVFNALDFDIDSPEPPSAMKNWHTRSYNLPPTSPLKLSLGKAKSPAVLGNSVNKNNASLLLDEGADDSLDLDLDPRAANKGLQDFGGTTARIDDLLDQENLARLVDDDEQQQQRGSTQEYYEEEDDYDSAQYRPANLNLNGPEDTLFGMPQAGRNAGAGPKKQARFDSLHDDTTEDSFSQPAQLSKQQQGKFKVMGIREHDMETLHGGQLLESEPYVESPLMKRDARY